MLETLTNYFWQHPVAVVAGLIAVIIILIWMTGSGSRQRFVTFKRTKETGQLARDLSRIAAALERIAKNQQTPMDYVGRPIPPNWESTISSGEPAEENGEPQHPELHLEEEEHVAAGPPAGNRAQSPNAPAANPPSNAPSTSAAREASSSSFADPLGGTASMLGGKKKLDLPNPLYRPKS